MHRTVWIAGACIISMMLMTSSIAHKSYAQVPEWTESSPHLVGEARFRFFFFDIYNAALFAPNGRYDGTAPYALKFSYLRDVSSQTIADTSVDEMRRQGVSDEARLAEWAGWMEQNFPDMQNGDEAVMVALADGGMAFYHNQIKSGQTDDPEFTKAFFAIWLSENTLKPDFGRRLRGLGAG